MPVIVKLGGSFARSPLLRAWVCAIEASRLPVVLVPGGGPFADAVRAAQPDMGFDDRAAHDMALLAMAQYGRALVSLGHRLILAGAPAGIEAALASGQVPVWSPDAAMLAREGVPATWAITSDSLALILARGLAAERAVLVKQRAAAADADPASLVREGLVDAAFPEYRAAFAGEVRIVGPLDTAVLE